MKAAGWSDRCLHNAVTPFSISVGQRSRFSSSSPRRRPLPLRRFHHGTFHACACASVASVPFNFPGIGQNVLYFFPPCMHHLREKIPRASSIIDALHGRGKRIVELAAGVEPATRRLQSACSAIEPCQLIEMESAPFNVRLTMQTRLCLSKVSQMDFFGTNQAESNRHPVSPDLCD